jgi:hypothetical protein
MNESHLYRATIPPVPHGISKDLLMLVVVKQIKDETSEIAGFHSMTKN